MSGDWDSTEMRMWRKAATIEQQEYFNWLGDRTWTKFKPSDYDNLKRNIGFAIFGPPEQEPDEMLNGNTGYTEGQLKHIIKVFDVIKNYKRKHINQQDIWVSFILVSGKVGDCHVRIPVIRVPEYDLTHEQNNNIFIDSCPRVYKDWKHYLQSNKLPECVLCYPRDGVYSAVDGVVQIEFGISPAGKTKAKVVQGLDIGGSLLGLAAESVELAGQFVPVAGPIIAGARAISVACGGYAAARNIATLVDRSEHEQSIGLDDPESLNCWLGIGAYMTYITSGDAAAEDAETPQAGDRVSSSQQITMKTLARTGSLVFNAIAVIRGLSNIIIKINNEKQVSSLDILQLTSSVLFFTNCIISNHQAYALVKSIGTRTGEFQDDVRTFMNHISEFVKATSKNISGVIELCTFALIESSSMMSYAVQKLLGTCKLVCRELTEITKSLVKGVMNMTNYMMRVGRLLHSFWESWNEEMTEVIHKICKAFGVKHWSDIVIKGFKVLQGAEPGCMGEIASTIITERMSLPNCGSTARPSIQSQGNSEDKTIENKTLHNESSGAKSFVQEKIQTTSSYEDEVINIHAQFVDIQGCKNPADFLQYMKFICKFVRSEFEKEESNYKKMWEMVQKFKPGVTVEDFDKEYGISGNRYDHFLQKVLEKFRNEDKEGFFWLKLAYDKQNACASARGEAEQSFFVKDGIAFHTFNNKTGQACNGMLSKEQYLEMAAELTDQYASRRNTSVEVDGNVAVMQVNAGTVVITVKSYPECGKVSGIATILHTTSQ